MSDEKPIIRLWQLTGLGLIISHPSGVIYSNQTGGYACDHRELEGVFVPLADADVDQYAPLDEHFYSGPKWRGHCYNGIDEETAAVVDGILATSYLTRRLSVDREKLASSDEAWIYVIIAPHEGNDDRQTFHGYPSGVGVLTWPNSD